MDVRGDFRAVLYGAVVLFCDLLSSFVRSALFFFLVPFVLTCPFFFLTFTFYVTALPFFLLPRPKVIPRLACAVCGAVPYEGLRDLRLDVRPAGTDSRKLMKRAVRLGANEA